MEGTVFKSSQTQTLLLALLEQVAELLIFLHHKDLVIDSNTTQDTLSASLLVLGDTLFAA
jgi:hypothetical protein